VSYYHRLFDPELLAYPRQVVGESLHRVALMGLVALAVPTQVNRYDSVLTTEVLELGDKVIMVAAPPVNEDEGRLPAACLFLEQRHPFPTQLSHRICYLFAVC
jgi:hypothetical protein